MTAQSSLAHRKPRLLSASSGKVVWPFCTMELANKILKGMCPEAKRVIKIMCGPDSGIIPINTAAISMGKGLLLIHPEISK